VKNGSIEALLGIVAILWLGFLAWKGGAAPALWLDLLGRP
jgi:hypothetical protein